MKWERLLVISITFHAAAAGIIYLWQRDLKHALYWLGVAFVNGVMIYL